MIYQLTLAGPGLKPEVMMALDDACAQRNWRLLSVYLDENGLHAVVRARASATSVARTLADVSKLRLLGSMEWQSDVIADQLPAHSAFYVAAP